MAWVLCVGRTASAPALRAREADEHTGGALRGQAQRAGERLRAREKGWSTVETSGISPTEFPSFPSASIRGRMPFLNRETVSSDLTLSSFIY
jgi:hypothetical protein